MLKITNPTKQDVSFVYLGQKHTVEAESSVNKPEGVADAWKKTHQFLTVEPLQIRNVTDKVEAPVVKPKAGKKDKVEAPVVPEVVEEDNEDDDEEGELDAPEDEVADDNK